MIKYSRYDEFKLKLKNMELMLNDECEQSNLDIRLIDSNGYKYKSTVKLIMADKMPKKFLKSNIYSIDNIRNWLLRHHKDVILVSDVYNGANEPLVIKCSKCGCDYITTWNRLYSTNGVSCNECSRNITKREDMKRIIEEMGYSITKYPKNINDIIHIKDVDGYKYKAIYYNVVKGSKLYKFHKLNPYTLENIQLWLDINNSGCNIVSTKYVSYEDVLNFRCKCGKIFSRSFNSVHSNNSWNCKECTSLKMRNLFNLKYDEVKDTLSNNGLKILSDKYNNASDKIKATTKEGYIVFSSFSNLKNNSYDIFSKSNPYTIYNIKNFIKINNMNCELLSNEYIDNKSLLEFRCECCGKTFKTSWNIFQGKNKTKCDSCSGKQSSYSKLVESFLKENNIKYEKEYSFDDCKYKNTLSFDFAILKDNGNIKILIECDGEQHFKPIRFNSISIEEANRKFRENKIRDSIKNKYCRNKNIKLIRISYIQFNNNEYMNILKTSLL